LTSFPICICLVSFLFLFLFFFPYLITLAKTSNSMLNEERERMDTFVLFLILEEMISVLLNLIYVGLRFIAYSLYYVDMLL
jgi:phage-related holin